jgi:S-DNA-T family DNA segregation ATPase FtsK/SpoIIIE
VTGAGAKDIEEYTERAGREPRPGPLPRLVIVIDEFASLARDLRAPPGRPGAGG